MPRITAAVGGTPVWAGDTADARPGLVATQTVRRGRRLGARGRLEPTVACSTGISLPSKIPIWLRCRVLTVTAAE